MLRSRMIFCIFRRAFSPSVVCCTRCNIRRPFQSISCRRWRWMPCLRCIDQHRCASAPSPPIQSRILAKELTGKQRCRPASAQLRGCSGLGRSWRFCRGCFRRGGEDGSSSRSRGGRDGCSRTALRLSEVIPLLAAERASSLGSLIFCAAFLHRQGVSRPPMLFWRDPSRWRATP